MLFATHAALSLISFYVINWFGKHMSYSGYMSLSLFYKADESPIFNNLFRILSPSILLIFYCFLLQKLNLTELVQNIWLTVPYMFAFRAIYNFIHERGPLLNWLLYIGQTACASAFAYWIYKELISKNEFYFPDLQSFGSEFWLLVILFVYQTLNGVQISQDGSHRRKENYIKNRCEQIRNEFSSMITSKASDQKIEKLVYSIIIIESFNRPTILRWLERLGTRFFGLTLSQGAMQVQSNQLVSDKQSIEMGINILNENYEKVLAASKGKNPEYFKEGEALHDHYILKRVAWLYNNSDTYSDDVMNAYNEIDRLFYSTPKPVKDKFNAFSNLV